MAAGDGDRLGSITTAYPKALLPVNGKALVSYPIEAMAAAGIQEIAIIVGYLGDSVINMLGSGSDFGVRLQYITNSDYFGGNAFSLYKARDWVQEEPVVLCMADHLIEKKMVNYLLSRRIFSETLCIDYTPAKHHQLAEATKVTVDKSGDIERIGKDLDYWDALDSGVFLLTKNFFQALQHLVCNRGIEVEITEVIRFLIGQGHPFGTCNVSGCFWLDVDTEEDLDAARK